MVSTVDTLMTVNGLDAQKDIYNTYVIMFSFNHQIIIECQWNEFACELKDNNDEVEYTSDF